MHHINEMLRTHPRAKKADFEVLSECLNECFSCAATCVTCADACLAEERLAEIRRCITHNLDCADICEATGRVLARISEYDSPIKWAQVDICARMCVACAKECQKHASHHEHCRICMESCDRCAELCQRLVTQFER